MQLSNLQQIKELIDQAKNVFVIVGPKAGLDELAAASALFTGFQVADKEAKLLSVSVPKQKFGINKLEELKTEVGHQNLLVSFDYSEEAVDKVSYHIGEETNKFYLTIKPKKGYEPLNTNTVEFSYTGADADLIVLIGVGSLEELDQLYFGYEKLFQDTAVVSIYEYPTNFGTVQYDTSETTGYAEFVAQLMNETELYIDEESATHLLASIERASKGFRSPKTSADTFDVVAKLLRSGAVRSEEKQMEPAKPVDQSTKSGEQPAKQAKSQEISIKQDKDRSKNQSHSHQQRSQVQNQPQSQQQRQKQKNQSNPGGLNYQPTAGEGGTNS